MNIKMSNEKNTKRQIAIGFQSTSFGMKKQESQLCDWGIVLFYSHTYVYLHWANGQKNSKIFFSLYFCFIGCVKTL